MLLVKSVSSEVIKHDLPERLCDLWLPAQPTLSIYLPGNRYDHLNIPEAEIMEAQSTHKDAALKFFDVTVFWISRTVTAGCVMLSADVRSIYQSGVGRGYEINKRMCVRKRRNGTWRRESKCKQSALLTVHT